MRIGGNSAVSWCIITQLHNVVGKRVLVYQTQRSQGLTSRPDLRLSIK